MNIPHNNHLLPAWNHISEDMDMETAYRITADVNAALVAGDEHLLRVALRYPDVVSESRAHDIDAELRTKFEASGATVTQDYLLAKALGVGLKAVGDASMSLTMLCYIENQLGAMQIALEADHLSTALFHKETPELQRKAWQAQLFSMRSTGITVANPLWIVRTSPLPNSVEFLQAIIDFVEPDWQGMDVDEGAALVTEAKMRNVIEYRLMDEHDAAEKTGAPVDSPPVSRLPKRAL